MIDLSLIWLLLIGVAVLIYVMLDGFDLGIGVLFPWVRKDSSRDIMMNTIAPFWDGNETWLVFGGVCLFAAFPAAYAILLQALYPPIMLMLLGLILRGVAFEFRFKADRSLALWDWLFCGGSSLAAFSQIAEFSLGNMLDNLRSSYAEAF